MLGVCATPDEVAARLPGDDLVPDAQVTMDRAFDLPAVPEILWPWLAQLGKQRAGWYLPAGVERPTGGHLRHDHRDTVVVRAPARQP
ncbi:MAG TPA: hypothetical protein VGH76_08775 [Actinomycetospora sp.]|uniref:hypothetical protein n=1 Tax=Actinomycetospora sp. TaxID=1872135 RepID=UPI002F3E55AA